jgi:hypothetical protein
MQQVSNRRLRLDEKSVAVPCIGSNADAYDNTIAEAWVANLKSKLVDGRRFPSCKHGFDPGRPLFRRPAYRPRYTLLNCSR